MKSCKSKNDELTNESAVRCIDNNLKKANEHLRDYGKKWMTKIFDKIDTDHYGKLTKKELEVGLKRLQEKEENIHKKKASKLCI